MSYYNGSYEDLVRSNRGHEPEGLCGDHCRGIGGSFCLKNCPRTQRNTKPHVIYNHGVLSPSPLPLLEKYTFAYHRDIDHYDLYQSELNEMRRVKNGRATS